MRKSIKVFSIKFVAALFTLLLLFGLRPNSSVFSAPSVSDLFHDPGYIYMSPLEPTAQDPVVLRLRAKADDLESAEIKYYDSADSSFHYITMQRDGYDATGYYEFWKGTVPASPSTKRYRFAVTKDNISYFIDSRMEPGADTGSYMEWDFWIVPGFTTPDWSKGALWYSVMPDSFYNSDLRNDYRTGVRPSGAWDVGAGNTHPVIVDAANGNKHIGQLDWYGGDLNGIKQKVQSYLKDTLGIEALYMNPIWDSQHNAGYGQNDYSTINPVLGTNEDLKDLISTSHQNNMKVMLDGVFRYHLMVGKWFNKVGYYPIQGAYQSQQSVYFPRFYFTNWPNEYEKDWGSPVINFSSTDVKNEIYKNSDSVMQKYLKAPYDADGWRMDVGETLWGSGGLTAGDILKDMRTYVKSAKSDAVFIVENGFGEALNGNIMDSHWNYEFCNRVREWSTGVQNQTMIELYLRNALRKFPRQVALTSYNLLSSHDITRILNASNYDSGLVNCAQILQMTYLGSPSIYFGDETGESADAAPGMGNAAPTSFNSFNWDRSTWDYKTLNLYRSLSELRSQYPTLKTGIYKKLLTDDTNKIFSFGRWDENAKIITVINQADTSKTVTVNARELSILDNSTMTEWFTGKTYTVTNGTITLDVPSKYGAILIEGAVDTGKFRNQYETQDIGNVPVQGKTVINAQDSFTIDASGSIGGASDNFRYVSLPAYNDFSITSRVDSLQNGDSGIKAGIMVRENTDPGSKYYAVFAKNSGVYYSYREQKAQNAVEASGSSATTPTWLKVERKDNVFRAYTASDVNGVPGTWTLLSGSEKQIGMDSEVLYGLAVASSDSTLKETQLSKLSITDIGKQKYDDFNKTVPGSMFNVINPDTANYSVSNGKLNITTLNQNKNIVVANAPYGQDWSAKVKLDFDPTANGQEADLIAYQDDDNYVKVCKIYKDGQVQLGFATVINGHTDYNILKQDAYPDGEVYLQLQRIGSRYAAVYSYDGVSWSDLGTAELANFSNTYVGMTARSSDTSVSVAMFDYFTFGNIINGENSYNSSVCETAQSISMAVDTNAPWEKLVFDNGNWQYAEGGYSQTDTGYNKRMSIADRQYTDFYMEVSTKFNSSLGWAGVSFRRSNYNDSYHNSGYLLWLLADGKISLYKTGSNLPGADLIQTNADMSKPVRLQIIAKAGRIKVFVNNGKEPVIDVSDSSFTAGYVSLYTNEASVDFTNLNLMDNYPVWTPFRGIWKEIQNGVRQDDYQSGQNHWMSMTGKAFRDVIVQADLKLSEASTSDKWAGILLHSSMGKDPDEDGLLVYLRKNGNIGIKTPTTVLQEVSSGANLNNPVNIKVVCIGDSYKVYVNGSVDPVLDVINKDYPSGTVSLATRDCKSDFTNVKVQGMKGNYSTNLAAKATVTASSSIESYGFYLSYLNDMNIYNGWASTWYTDPNHTEWLQLDLGEDKTFNRVDLYPRRDNSTDGLGFPADFAIKVSNDGVNWVTKVSKTNYQKSDSTVQSFYLGSVTARYIKIEATKLGMADLYRFLLFEVGVYNNNILAEDTFSSGDALWKPYSGTWTVNNGEYHQSDLTSWNDGSTIISGKYTDFSLEYKLKIQPASTWAGVNIRKVNDNDTHEQSGYLIYMNSSGRLAIYKNGVGDLQYVQTNVSTQNYNTIKVVANGSNIKVYVNGSSTPALDVTDTTYSKGYLSLVTGCSDTYFDDVKVLSAE